MAELTIRVGRRRRHRHDQLRGLARAAGAGASRHRRLSYLSRWLRSRNDTLNGTATINTVTYTNATNLVTLAAHGVTVGDFDGPYRLENSGGALPAELATNTAYWFRATSATEGQLFPSRKDAANDTNVVAFTDDGTGTNTILASALATHAQPGILGFGSDGKKVAPTRYQSETDLDNLTDDLVA